MRTDVHNCHSKCISSVVTPAASVIATVYSLLWFMVSYISADGFPTGGNAIENVSSSQMLHLENAACFMDTRCKYGEIYESTPTSFAVERYLKIDGGKTDNICLGKVDEICTKSKKTLPDVHGSFQPKEDRRNSDEKAQEITMKSCLPRLVPNVSFNDKLLPSSPVAPSQRRKSAVYRVSFKRKSYDGEEATEICEYTIHCDFLRRILKLDLFLFHVYDFLKTEFLEIFKSSSITI